MLRRLISTAFVAGLSLACLASGAPAQDLGTKQLQDAAVAAFARLGLDSAMIPALTHEELMEIQAITGDAVEDAARVGRIETVLREAEARIVAAGGVVPEPRGADVAVGLEASVGQSLARLGLAGDVDVDALTPDQLLRIQAIGDGGDGPAEQRAQIERVIAAD
jgi:hypothetical protein